MSYDILKTIPSNLKEKYNEIPEEIKTMPEDRLELMFTPKVVFYQLKNKLWEEIKKKSSDANYVVTLEGICSGICHVVTFNTYIEDKYLLAWLMSPFPIYDVVSNAILCKATKRYEDLVNMKITTIKRRKNEDGEIEYYEDIDAKKADILLRTIQNIENRVLGTAIQKNININSDGNDIDKDTDVTFDIDEINKRIAELEGRSHGREIKKIRYVQEEKENDMEGSEGDC